MLRIVVMVTVWNIIRRFYYDKFGIPEFVVDIMADIDICLLFVSGSSNDSISRFISVDPGAVSRVIKKRFGVPGRRKNLSINPYKEFKLSGGDKSKFVTKAGDSDSDTLWRCCSIYSNMEKVLNGFWK